MMRPLLDQRDVYAAHQHNEELTADTSMTLVQTRQRSEGDDSMNTHLGSEKEDLQSKMESLTASKTTIKSKLQAVTEEVGMMDLRMAFADAERRGAVAMRRMVEEKTLVIFFLTPSLYTGTIKHLYEG
ncbi:hypothetical protein Fot_42809 [Forsythia ovata]|uniref:Uncharacterized protein n=1 Tax=Forsythia ovata TaxID=205694 RepID=A0ABD1RNS6_9LAMI